MWFRTRFVNQSINHLLITIKADNRRNCDDKRIDSCGNRVQTAENGLFYMFVRIYLTSWIKLDNIKFALGLNCSCWCKPIALGLNQKNLFCLEWLYAVISGGRLEEKNAAASKLQAVFRQRLEQRTRNQELGSTLPKPAMKQCFVGHRNSRTMVRADHTDWKVKKD